VTERCSRRLLDYLILNSSVDFTRCCKVLILTTPLFPDKLMKELTDFGLSENESRAYLALLQLRKATARSIARLAGIPRQEIYRVMPTLEKLELVECVIANPEEFVAMPPSEALSALIGRLKEDFTKQIANLEKGRMELQSELEKVEGKSAGLLVPEPVHFLLISGRHLLNDKIEGMLEKAKHLVQWVSPKLEMKRAVIYDRDKTLRRCARRGIKIRILTEVAEDNILEVRKLGKFAEIRHSPNIASLMTIVDDREIMIGSAIDASDTELIHELWTNDQGLVNTMKEFFERVWKDSKPAELSP
jgi:sugar-specific transcriptional regulator TrmB